MLDKGIWDGREKECGLEEEILYVSFLQFQAMSSCDLMVFVAISTPAIISIIKIESFYFIWWPLGM